MTHTDTHKQTTE